MIHPILCKVLNLPLIMNPEEFFNLNCSQTIVIILIDEFK